MRAVNVHDPRLSKEAPRLGKVRVIQVLIILSALVGLLAIQSARPRRGVLTSKA
jgi:hypothetical protein